MLQKRTDKPICKRRTMCDCSRLVVPSSSPCQGLVRSMDPLFSVPVAHLTLAHFQQHFCALKHTAGVAQNKRSRQWSWKCSYLDAEWCAALEKLLYVVQTLAVVLRFLVNLQRGEPQMHFQFTQRGSCAFTLQFPEFLSPENESSWSTRILQSTVGLTLREAGLRSRSGEVEQAVVLGRGKWRRQIEIPTGGGVCCGCTGFCFLKKIRT